MNDLKRKILNCEKVCGTHVSMSDFMSADILGSLGYDFIWVDTIPSACWKWAWTE